MNDSEELSHTATIQPNEVVKQARLAAISSLLASSSPKKESKGLDRYEMMKKVLPEAAVKQRMEQDGLSTAEIDAFFNSNC